MDIQLLTLLLITFTCCAQALLLVPDENLQNQRALISSNNRSVPRFSQITDFTAPSLVAVGQPLEAICTKGRHTSGKIYFLKNYKVIPDESKQVLRTGNGTFALLSIPEASLYDTGYYSCSIGGVEDTVTKVVAVEEKISPAPTFFSTSSSSSEDNDQLPLEVIQTLSTIDGPPPPPVNTSVRVTTPTAAAAIDENPQIILVYVAAGQELRLDCETRLRSAADLAILWFTKYHYRFSPIAQSDDVRWFLNGTLIFKRVESLGPRALVCVSTRLDGTREESKEVYLLVQRSPPRISTFNLPESVSQGSSLLATCATERGLLGGQRLRFTKDDRPLDESLYYHGEGSNNNLNRKRSTGNATLYLPEVGLTDGGRYTCWAENTTGSASKSVVLRVTTDQQRTSASSYSLSSSSASSSSSSSPSTVVSTPNTDVEVRQTVATMGVYAVAGHRLQLDCRSTGSSASSNSRNSRNLSSRLQWTFVNSRQPALRNSSTQTVFPNGTLVLRALSESAHHNQILQCIASNSGGSEGGALAPSKFVFLLLREGPRVVSFSASPVDVRVGETLVLLCRFANFGASAGKRHEKAKFFKNGLQPLGEKGGNRDSRDDDDNEDDRVEIVQQQHQQQQQTDSAALRIRSVRLDDSGEYTCRLDEFTEKTITVKVRGKNRYKNLTVVI